MGFIGGASLERKTPRTHARLTLSRVTQPGSGVGASQNVNSIDGNLRVDLAARLAFVVDGRWQAYDAAANGAIFVGFAPGPPGDTLVGVSCFRDSENEAAYELTSASARLDWRVWEHWVTFVQYRYLHQTSSGEIAVSEFDNHRVSLGMRYALPIDVF